MGCYWEEFIIIKMNKFIINYNKLINKKLQPNLCFDYYFYKKKYCSMFSINYCNNFNIFVFFRIQ